MSAARPIALRGRAITKRFGSLAANDGVDLDVGAGEILGLVGENGAGKSTLMNVLYGVLAPDSGTIEVDGTEVRFAGCADGMRAGIGMVFQHYLLVDRFTVAENVLLGIEPGEGIFVDRQAAVSAVERISARYRFALDPTAPVESLGIGARQQVELLRVLERNPKIIILDEPTAALSPAEIDGLFEVMNRLRAEGKAVIFITHKLKEVMRLCDRITVLRRGQVVGTVDRAAADETMLASMMVGTSPGPDVRAAALAPGQPEKPDATVRNAAILAIEGLSVTRDDGSSAVAGLDLVCRAGEVVGVAGVEGNGQVELAEALYGIRSPGAGTIVLDGEDVSGADTAARRREGMRYISQDRQREGLVLDFDAVENALIGDARASSHAGLLDRALGRRRAATIARDLRVTAYDERAPLRGYSGGTQQKFLVGRETEGAPKAIVAFAPTRGVDIRAAGAIYDRLRAMRAAGACVLLVSYDLDEIRELADRIVVMHRGAIVGVLTPAQADDATLGRLMGGGT